MRIIEDVLRDMLPREAVNETCPLPPAEKKRRAKERKKDTEERRRDAERKLKRMKKTKQVTNPMEDVMNTFRSFANGVMEEDTETIEDIDDETIVLEVPDDWMDEAKKKKKKNCGGLSGSAVYRDENGHFSSKKDAKVFTIKKYKGSDCRHGTTRVKGNNDSIATSLPCGAVSATSKGGVGHHKKRCKDSSDKW